MFSNCSSTLNLESPASHGNSHSLRCSRSHWNCQKPIVLSPSHSFALFLWLLDVYQSIWPTQKSLFWIFPPCQTNKVMQCLSMLVVFYVGDVVVLGRSQGNVCGLACRVWRLEHLCTEHWNKQGAWCTCWFPSFCLACSFYSHLQESGTNGSNGWHSLKVFTC